MVREIQREHGVTLGVGPLAGQFRLFSGHALGRIVKAVVGIVAEGKGGGCEVQPQFHLMVHGRRAEQVDQVDPRGQAFVLAASRTFSQIPRPQPALADAGSEPQLQAQGVGLEFFHHDPCHAQDFAALLVGAGAQAQFPWPGGGRGFQGEGEFAEAVGCERDLFGGRLVAARIVQGGRQRQTREIRGAPLPLFDHVAEVQALAGAVDAALAEQVDIESLIGKPVAAYVETRIVELARVLLQRQKGQIAPLRSGQGQRSFFPREARERGQIHLAARIGFGPEHGQAVDPDHLDVHLGARPAVGQTHSVDRAAAPGGGFMDQPQIRHQHKAVFPAHSASVAPSREAEVEQTLPAVTEQGAQVERAELGGHGVTPPERQAAPVDHAQVVEIRAAAGIGLVVVVGVIIQLVQVGRQKCVEKFGPDLGHFIVHGV